MSSPVKSLLFAAALCVVCSLLLTAASTGLKSYQQRNIAVDRHKNILKAMGVIANGQQPGAEQIEALYRDNVKALWVDRAGRVVPDADHRVDDLPLYVYVKDNAIEAYVVPIDTRGLWGRINGYLAIENDGSTVRGFTVYNHSETPGLGGEIESRWFRKNFEGKKILDHNGHFVAVKVAKGLVKDVIPVGEQVNYVDGISGATMTGKFLSAGLTDILKDYEPVAIHFRAREQLTLPGQDAGAPN